MIHINDFDINVIILNYTEIHTHAVLYMSHLHLNIVTLYVLTYIRMLSPIVSSDSTYNVKCSSSIDT